METGAGSTVSGTGGLYDLCAGWMGRHEPADACVYPGAYRARILENRPRPVLLNSWEACYFDISESRLLKLAKVGKDAGIELFVVDDGWFGRRNDDTSSLGDWVPNTKTARRLIAPSKNYRSGACFGIWVEPEMVSVDSDLYRKHPDWTIEIPGNRMQKDEIREFWILEGEKCRSISLPV